MLYESEMKKIERDGFRVSNLNSPEFSMPHYKYASSFQFSYQSVSLKRVPNKKNDEIQLFSTKNCIISQNQFLLKLQLRKLFFRIAGEAVGPIKKLKFTEHKLLKQERENEQPLGSTKFNPCTNIYRNLQKRELSVY